MGDSKLISMCENFSRISQKRKLIFIFDNDNPDIKKKINNENNEQFKSWGNNVFSFTLPVPQHRISTPEISIEHYYTDNIIQTFIDNDKGKRRLFLGNEFDTRGISKDKKFTCTNKNKCGDNKIAIIDYQKNKGTVTLINNENENVALSKMEFADIILKEEFPTTIDFSSFIPLFEIIKNILTQKNN